MTPLPESMGYNIVAHIICAQVFPILNGPDNDSKYDDDFVSVFHYKYITPVNPALGLNCIWNIVDLGIHAFHTCDDSYFLSHFNRGYNRQPEIGHL